MAQLLQPFDARNVDPSQGLGGMPIGKHPVIIIKSEVKPTKDNDSGYLQCDLSIIDGPNKGAVGAYRLNLYHSNSQTVEIAHKQLSALCHVTGVYQVQDSQQLHNIPFVVEVGLQKEPNPNKYTEIKRVFDINGNEPGQAGQGNQQQQPVNNQQQPQNQQPQGGGNNAGWGGGQQIANNVAMPGNDQQQQPQNNQQQPAQGGWNQQGSQPQNNQQQPQGNQQQPQGGNPAWAQGGNAGGAPSWGQPRN